MLVLDVERCLVRHLRQHFAAGAVAIPTLLGLDVDDLPAGTALIGRHVNVRHLGALVDRFVQWSQNLLLLLALMAVDSPEVKLLNELVVSVLILELREDPSVITKIVDHVIECLAIAIEEHLVVDLLQLMHV